MVVARSSLAVAVVIFAEMSDWCMRLLLGLLLETMSTPTLLRLQASEVGVGSHDSEHFFMHTRREALYMGVINNQLTCGLLDMVHNVVNNVTSKCRAGTPHHRIAKFRSHSFCPLMVLSVILA